MSTTKNATIEKLAGELKQVPLEQIQQKPHEYRDKEVVESDDFQDLFLSIKIHGVLQPITLTPTNNGKKMYQIIDGARRFRVCIMQSKTSIPAIIKNADQIAIKRQALVWSYVQNVQTKQLTDIEKAKAIRTIYENQGYSIENTLQYLNNIRNNKYAKQELTVPEQFVELASSIGHSNSYQWFLLKLLKDVPEPILKYAEDAGLDTAKKQMLTYPEIRKDPQLQRAVVNMIKDIPKGDARQLVHNIETGAYKFTGKGFKVLQGASEKLQTRPPEFTRDAFVSFNEATNLSRKLLHQLTGMESNNYQSEDIRATRNYRLERIKQLTDRDLNIFWNVLKPLKSVIEDQMSQLEEELRSRSGKKKLMEK